MHVVRVVCRLKLFRYREAQFQILQLSIARGHAVIVEGRTRAWSGRTPNVEIQSAARPGVGNDDRRVEL